MTNAVYSTIPQAEHVLVATKLNSYIALAPSRAQTARSAATNMDAVIGWYMERDTESTSPTTVYKLCTSKGKMRAHFKQRYYQAMRLLNRYIMWNGTLALAILNALEEMESPWSTEGERPSSIEDVQDPWFYLHRLTWQVNSMTNIRKAVVEWAANKNLVHEVNPFLHIWVTAMYWFPADPLLQGSSRIDDKLHYNPDGECVLCVSHMVLISGLRTIRARQGTTL